MPRSILMRKTLVKINNGLMLEEYERLSKDNRTNYNETFFLSLLAKNKEQGLTLQEATECASHLSKPTVLKFLERLLAKRQIFRVHRDKLIIYYPNNRPLHPLFNESINLGDKKYGIQLIDNLEGLSLFVQEIHRDLIGIETVSGGIMIPFNSIDKIMDTFNKIRSQRFKLVEEFKKQKLAEIDKKLKIEGGYE